MEVKKWGNLMVSHTKRGPAFLFPPYLDPRASGGLRWHLFLQQVGRTLIAPAVAENLPRRPFAACLVLRANKLVHGQEKEVE